MRQGQSYLCNRAKNLVVAFCFIIWKEIYRLLYRYADVIAEEISKETVVL